MLHRRAQSFEGRAAHFLQSNGVMMPPQSHRGNVLYGSRAAARPLRSRMSALADPGSGRRFRVEGGPSVSYDLKMPSIAQKALVVATQGFESFFRSNRLRPPTPE